MPRPVVTGISFPGCWRTALRALLLPGLLGVLGLLAACAHAPPKTAPPAAVPMRPIAAASASPAAAAPASAGTASDAAARDSGGAGGGTQTFGSTEQEADGTAAAAAASEPSVPVAGLAPAQYADLFDRMRAGFKLADDPSRTPIEQQLNWYVNNPDYIERAFGRAELYLYHIVTELESRGMPLELALLPVVESAFEPYAYSVASASGLWQFIPGTGSRFGLKQDWWYDGRRDVVESTRAALDYLRALHDEFGGDWLLAIAAYNCGELAVERAIEINRSAGRPIDFWSLRLPAETRAYVPKLLAMRRLVAEPERYGLSISPIPNQPYFARVATGGQINLKLAAEIAGVTPEEVYELNPAYHRWATDPGGPHFLLLPVDAADTFSANLNQLSGDERLGVARYVVRRGDTVSAVARHFHTSVNVIRELNEMPRGTFAVGTELRVPAAEFVLPQKVMLAAARVDGRGRSLRRPHVHVVREGESLWAIARHHGMNVRTLARMNGLRPGDHLRAGQRVRLSRGGALARHAGDSARRVTYVVRNGDTLARIARLFQVKVSQILAWNGMSAHSPILAGQKLTIHVGSRRG